jgi:hypothetical protein
MSADSDRPHARSATAVRNTKRSVKIQVAHLYADLSRPAEPDLRVEVGAVHLDLPARGVNDRANFLDRGFGQCSLTVMYRAPILFPKATGLKKDYLSPSTAAEWNQSD